MGFSSKAVDADEPLAAGMAAADGSSVRRASYGVEVRGVFVLTAS